MRKVVWLLACLLPLSLLAQNGGVRFVHGLTWQQVKAKAKADNKYIFMDCYTTWCGPCKYMSNAIFPQPEVGKVLNDSFINIKIQLDTAADDNAETKKMYATAHAIGADYHVNVYPTYLFFNPAGELVHRAVGSSEASAFIAKVKEALNPDAQYYTLMNKYNNGKRGANFLYELTKAAASAYDLTNAERFAKEYVATQPDLYTAASLTLLRDLTQGSTDTGFAILLNQPQKVDSILGKGAAGDVIQRIILTEDVYPKMFEQNVATAKDLVEPDWNEIKSTLTQKYPLQAQWLVAYAKVVFYQNKTDWDKFCPAVADYLNDYEKTVSAEQLNSFAWTVFENYSDAACLQKALAWSRLSLNEDQPPVFIDTYANLLYRLGQTDEAIAWEQKALNLVSEEKKPLYQVTIDKMRNGTPTWN